MIKKFLYVYLRHVKFISDKMHAYLNIEYIHFKTRKKVENASTHCADGNKLSIEIILNRITNGGKLEPMFLVLSKCSKSHILGCVTRNTFVPYS